MIVMSHLNYNQRISIYRMTDKGIKLVVSWLVVKYYYTINVNEDK